MLITAGGYSDVEGKGAVLVVIVRGRGVALFDAPAPVVGPGTASLVTAEGPCIASMTAWTIVGMSLEFKGVSIGVKEAGEETMVVDVLRLFDNWVDHDKGRSMPEGGSMPDRGGFLLFLP